MASLLAFNKVTNSQSKIRTMHSRLSFPLTFVVWICVGAFLPSARATSTYTYQPGEYVVIVDGKSPDGRYAIAAHGEGEDGDENFHLYLMDAETDKKIGPLEEIKDVLDTGADAYYARWSADSREVSITYRVDRHVAVMVRYRIANRRAYRISGPTRVEGLPQARNRPEEFWSSRPGHLREAFTGKNRWGKHLRLQPFPQELDCLPRA